MKLTTILTLFLATSLWAAHAQALDRAQSHDVPMMSAQAGEIRVGHEAGFASPDWTPSASAEGSQAGVADSVADGRGSVASGPSTRSFPLDYMDHMLEQSGKLITPVTTPSLAFSDSQHAVQISGVVTNDGKPVTGATVNVEIELDGGFVNFQAITVQVSIIADKQGFYATAVRAPAAITAVHVTSPSFCSVKNGCVYLYDSSVGAGATAQ